MGSLRRAPCCGGVNLGTCAGMSSLGGRVTGGSTTCRKDVKFMGCTRKVCMNCGFCRATTRRKLVRCRSAMRCPFKCNLDCAAFRGAVRGFGSGNSAMAFSIAIGGANSITNGSIVRLCCATPCAGNKVRGTTTGLVTFRGARALSPKTTRAGSVAVGGRSVTSCSSRKVGVSNNKCVLRTKRCAVSLHSSSRAIMTRRGFAMSDSVSCDGSKHSSSRAMSAGRFRSCSHNSFRRLSETGKFTGCRSTYKGLDRSTCMVDSRAEGTMRRGMFKVCSDAGCGSSSSRVPGVRRSGKLRLTSLAKGSCSSRS